MKRRTAVALTPAPLAHALRDALHIDEGQAQTWVKAGAVYVDGRRARDVSQKVAAGAVLTVVIEEGGQAALPVNGSAPAVSVLYRGDGLIAVDKPAGMVAQPTPSRVGDSLLDAVSALLGAPAGLVHRLDRETSGVTVFGATTERTSELARAFREGTAHKTYVAVTHPGLPASGTIDLPLSKDPSRPGRWRASRAANGISALTHYVRLHQADGYCVVQLLPQTGRTHQLRAHLTAIDCPILGDRLYESASGKSSQAPRCLLHAQRLEVLGHTFEAPLPPDFRPYWPVS